MNFDHEFNYVRYSTILKNNIFGKPWLMCVMRIEETFIIYNIICTNNAKEENKYNK